MSDAAQATVFLDRDGTLNVDHGYVHTLEAFEFLPGVPASLRRLARAGYRLIVVTNQSGVARGMFSEADVRALHAHIADQLEAVGVSIAAFYYCPCHPDHGHAPYRRACPNRKPGIGMFEQACREFPIDVGHSFMIGDRESDMVFAHRAGLQGIQVQTGQRRDPLPAEVRARTWVVPDLPAAADAILSAR